MGFCTVQDGIALTRQEISCSVNMASRLNSAIKVSMVSTRLVRTLLLLIALAVGVGSTTAAIACATMVPPSAVAAMPAEHCGTDRGSSQDAGKVAPCALACPTGCLMVAPIGINADELHFPASFDVVSSSPRLEGEAFGPEPPRPRSQVTA